jgi:hypothetical protein
MGIGEPGMEWEQRHFNGKRQCERPEYQKLGFVGDGHPHDFEQIESILTGKPGVLEIKIKQRHQHKDRAEHGKQHEFYGGVYFSRTAPDTDDEIHRYQHDLPENIEQKEVESAEDAEHPGGQKQHRDVITLDVDRDRVPG